MASREVNEPAGGKASSTDFPFALVVGLYVMASLVPAVMFLITRGVSDAGVLYSSFLAVVVGLTAAVGPGRLSSHQGSVTLGMTPSTEAAW